MGLDASVECTCRREGLTRPPPFAPELLIRDEDDWLTLDLPEGGDPEPWRRFDAWMRGCCEHPDMELARVRAASWPDLQAFDAALGRAGRDLFPTLSTEIPHLNGGTTNPAAAVRALAELALFEHRSDLGDNWYLVDVGTGIIVNDYDAIGAGRAFHLNAFVQADGSGIDMGFDPHGVYLVSRTEPPRELFRAMRLEQRAERHQGRPDSYRIEFVDLLAQVFRAAITTDNPVRWT
ncbi:MAG TPA: hypothetical protein VK611_05935 [Acidimicrobiales bacterium]|nr:hypothetical protein [Acidimicrobiales bacterium]